jgi:hypothetical protein
VKDEIQLPVIGAISVITCEKPDKDLYAQQRKHRAG